MIWFRASRATADRLPCHRSLWTHRFAFIQWLAAEARPVPGAGFVRGRSGKQVRVHAVDEASDASIRERVPFDFAPAFASVKRGLRVAELRVTVHCSELQSSSATPWR